MEFVRLRLEPILRLAPNGGSTLIRKKGGIPHLLVHQEHSTARALQKMGQHNPEHFKRFQTASTSLWISKILKIPQSLRLLSEIKEFQ